MINHLSHRIEVIDPSPTLAISAKARAMRENGIDVVSLSAGEPDFPTPDFITKAAIQALKKGDTKYGPAAGKPHLRQAVAHYLAGRHNRNVDPSEVIIGVGAKQILFDAASCLVEDGDEVLLPAPYWVSFPDMIRFAGGKLKIVDTQSAFNFVPTSERLEEYTTGKTRLLIINSPNNPTGSVLSRSDLEDIVTFLRANPRILVISDETYERLIYDGREHVSILQVAPDLSERILVVGSFSKAYAMTGWRLGYGYGPKELIAAMTRMAGASTSGPTSFVQEAGIVAITGDQSDVEHMRKVFEKRRDVMVSLINNIPKVTCRAPEGAFYVFVDVSAYLSGTEISNSRELVEYLLEQYNLAIVHGSAFGCEGFVRLSFAASDEQITEGVRRLQEGLGQIRT